jgi:hypothetical protein
MPVNIFNDDGVFDIWLDCDGGGPRDGVCIAGCIADFEAARAEAMKTLLDAYTSVSVARPPELT